MKSRSLLALLTCFVCLGIFIAVALGVRQAWILSLDNGILAFMNSHRSHPLTTISLGLQWLLLYPFKALLLVPPALLLIRKRLTWQAVVLFLGLVLDSIVVRILKIAFNRPRPEIGPMYGVEPSFPSGHAASSVVVYGLLAYVAMHHLARTRLQRAIIASLAVLMVIATGLSRLYLLVHFPSDVIAGFAVGGIILVGLIALLERVGVRDS